MENKIEEYAGFIIFFCIFTFFVGVTFYAVNQSSMKDRLSMNEIILFWTMIVFILYTCETSKLRKSAQKQVEVSYRQTNIMQNQVKEAHKQTELRHIPFIIFEVNKKTTKVNTETQGG